MLVILSETAGAKGLHLSAPANSTPTLFSLRRGSQWHEAAAHLSVARWHGDRPEGLLRRDPRSHASAIQRLSRPRVFDRPLGDLVGELGRPRAVAQRIERGCQRYHEASLSRSDGTRS